jgi:Cu(I)/Ag(I) efflux system membrane protein CusA/SilA
MTMGAALLPLLWSEGPGAEIMKRVAAPMLGGLVCSAFVTLEVIPVLQTLWRERQLRRACRLGVPLARIVGGRYGLPPRPAVGRSLDHDHT